MYLYVLTMLKVLSYCKMLIKKAGQIIGLRVYSMLFHSTNDLIELDVSSYIMILFSLCISYCSQK